MQKCAMVYEVIGDVRTVEHFSEFKYFGCVLDESETDRAKFCRQMGSGRRVVDAIRQVSFEC